jgi:hypothetical protein
MPTPVMECWYFHHLASSLATVLTKPPRLQNMKVLTENNIMLMFPKIAQAAITIQQPFYIVCVSCLGGGDPVA